MCAYSWRVPFTTSGQLELIGAQKIGVVGPDQTAPVFFEWSLLYNLSRGLLWVALIPLLVVRSNRHREAWRVLVPLLIIHVILLMLRRALFGGSSPDSVFGPTVSSLALMLAMLWLVAHKVASHGGVETFFRAAVLMVAIAVLGTLCDHGFGFWEGSVVGLVVSGLAALILLAGLTAARFSCRRRYDDRRFLLWLLLWVVVATAAALLLCTCLSWMLFGGFAYMSEMILQLLLACAMCLIAGVVGGIVLYLILLGYLLIAFRMSFYRARFDACFQLESTPWPESPA